MARGPRVSIGAVLEEWLAARARLRLLEELEHPDVVDEYGRVWVWRSGDLYAHDDTLALPLALIEGYGLPPAALVENPNYAGLCALCRSRWPGPVQLELFQIQRRRRPLDMGRKRS